MSTTTEITTKESELLDQRKATIEAAQEEIVEAAADGSKNPIESEPKIRALLEDSEKLREAAESERVEARAKALREETDAIAARLIADQTKRDIDRLGSKGEAAPSLIEQIRTAANNLSGVQLDVKLRNVEKFRTVVEQGVTATEIRQAQRSGDAAQLRALGVGTDSAGGILVPDVLETMIYDQMRLVQGLRSAGAEVLSTSNGEEIEYPRIDTANVPTAATITAEAAEIAATEDSYDSVKLNAYKFTSRMDLSAELMADHGTNLESLIATRLAEVVATKEEIAFTGGTGSSQPKGALHGVAAGNTVTSAFVASGNTATNAPKWKDFTDAIGDLDPLYTQAGLTWMMNSEVFWRIVGTLDGDSRPIYTPRTADRPFDQLLGYPVSYNNFMEKYATAKTIVGVGNWNRAYIIRDVGSFQLQTSYEARFVNQEVVILGSHRADGEIRDASAFRIIKTG